MKGEIDPSSSKPKMTNTDRLAHFIEQMPVAWITRNGYAVITEQFRNSIPGAKNVYTEPLYTAAQLAALTAQCAADKRDAEKWRALQKRLRKVHVRKLSESQLTEVHQMRMQGMKQKDIATKFNVSASAIGYILRHNSAIAAGNGEVTK